MRVGIIICGRAFLEGGDEIASAAYALFRCKYPWIASEPAFACRHVGRERERRKESVWRTCFPVSSSALVIRHVYESDLVGFADCDAEFYGDVYGIAFYYCCSDISVCSYMEWC